MQELRGKTATDVLRVAFAFDPTRSAILQVGGSKGTSQQRFYRQLIAKADHEYDAHLAALKKEN
jgi:hypothetical protein